MMNKKVISSILILLSASTLVYGAITYVNRYDTTPVYLLTSPDKAEITTGNQKFIGSQVVYLKPGTYNFKASRSGFKDENINVEVKKGNPLRIIFALTPTTEKAIKELQSSSKTSEIDRATTDRLANEQKKLEDANPIIKKLPIKNLIYSIGYKADPNHRNGVIVEIDTIEGYRNAALNKIKEQGFDPSKLNITFRNYANTFTE